MRVSKDVLPVLGIVAFSGCSVNAVANLFFERARHDTPLFWAAAVLVELCTAWLVWSIVETTRKVTKSNISKQDRRFHGIVLAVFVVLAIPSLSISIIANVIEFGGNVLLGFLFPVLSVACAVGAGLPQTVKRYESERQAEAREAQAERKARQAEKQAEARRCQAEAREAQEHRKLLSRLGNAESTLRQLIVNPEASQASIAQELSISRQAVSQHFDKLEAMGAIRRNGGDGVEVLWEVLT